MMPHGLLKKDNGEIYQAAKDSFLEARNSNVMNEIRREMLEGKKPEVCKLCWEEEKVGARSRRLWELQRDPEMIKKANALTESNGSIDHSNFPLTYIDLRLGNQCNLRCRYCGPTDSNSWYGDYVELGLLKENPAIFNMYGQEYEIVQTNQNWHVNSEDFNWPDNPNFLSMINDVIDHTESFYFTGGEPLLLQTHWDLLERCIEKGRAPYIYLEYNSNLSHLLDKHFEIWKHFKGVGIGCSIDGIGKSASYLRPPVEWSKIQTNLIKIVNAPFRIDATLSVTLSIFNVMNFMEVIEYNLNLRSQNFVALPSSHFLENPPQYSMKILPLKAKRQVIAEYAKFLDRMKPKLDHKDFEVLVNKVNSIESYLMSEDRSHMIKEFYRVTEILDGIRRQSFIEVFPNVHHLLQLK